MNQRLIFSGSLLVMILGAACKKQVAAGADTFNTATVVTSARAAATVVNSSWSVDWDNYATGPYTTSAAIADFGNITGWNESRAFISNGLCRIKLLKDALSADGGVIAKIDIVDGSAYELDFDIKFHSQFDFSRGGKVGFGFLIGEGNSGGDPSWNGNGGSLRLVWYQNNEGRVYFQPYVYYKDQPEEYGETFGLTYPATGSLSVSDWYHVHMYIKSNTGSNTNGRALISINNTPLLDKTLRWTTNDSNRLIRKISFSTFRGGSQGYWMSATDGYIYYNNLVVHKLAD